MAKKIAEYPSFEINPSKVPEEAFKVKSVIKKGEQRTLADEDGIEIPVWLAGTETNIIVDTRKFRKVFESDIYKIRDLSTPAIKVLCYIWTHLQVGKDEIFIDIKECSKYTKYESKVNVYKGILGLLEAGIIHRKTGISNYYIDVTLFFNGTTVKNR